ncbi:hypothetical protein M2373_004344 [Chryseobacterium sp. JUb7]|nr:hypothetical protein [Chryseobacterium sp. JUb7]
MFVILFGPTSDCDYGSYTDYGPDSHGQCGGK